MTVEGCIACDLMEGAGAAAAVEAVAGRLREWFAAHSG